MKKNRKAEHVEICATKPVLASYNYWDDIMLIHHALPELNKSEINLKTTLFKKKLKAPIIISAITGGYSKAKKINTNLASAASELQIGFGVGSQRPALESNDKVYRDSYSVIKDFNIPLVIGNIGAPQLIKQDNKNTPLTLNDGKFAMEMINADLLAIHMNYAQEIVQPEGDTNAKGCLNKIKEFASELPILAKETGAGISRRIAKSLKNAGVRGIDVGGYSGTSFPAVEMYRGEASGDELRARLGKLFWDWGIPTPVSLFEANLGLPLIATGGIKDGMDITKALCLGASAAGIAGRLLKPAMKSTRSVVKELEMIIEELRCTMFLVSAGSIKALNKNKAIIIGESRDILTAEGYLK
jgi:isopentenyl-diphosphate delta-isomerase